MVQERMGASREFVHTYILARKNSQTQQTTLL